MRKAKAVRITGFVGALCVSAALVGAAAQGTGAYFTDSHNGVVNASTGAVKVNVSDLTLNFQDLLPGEFKTNDINFTAAGTGAEDIWLVLPTDGTAVAFNGAGGASAALGRYGHVAVSSPSGDFSSYNLSTDPAGAGSAASCGTDANGHGGSNQQATSTKNSDPGSYVPYCPVPGAILLGSGLTYGQGGTAHVTFGFTKVLKSGQGAPLAPVAQFKIVATQAGISPMDVNNPS
ncbi:MAG: hypothetical protein QOH56_158 [Pseudonocardiales bacterium]|jgi:hypothetical protein|nr:hypothetical protein [Pseudonocardiales bacterium]